MSGNLERPIVVGVDGTDQGMLAVRYAVLKAHLLGCGIRLLHVAPETVPIAAMLPMISVETLDQVGQRIVDEARELVYDTSDDEIQVDQVVKSGSRVQALVEAGEDARLIVLGHRDRSILGRFFTSSTCTNVAARARCPVVCVPTVWQPGNRQGRVVVGVEGREHSQDALGVAFAAAAQRASRLTVLHAWKLQSPYDEIIVSAVALEGWMETATAMVEDVLRGWREAYPEVEVEVDVRHQHTVPALVGATEGADLLVLGRRGRRAPIGIHLGSTVRTLIREARCPVAVAPPRVSPEMLPSQRLTSTDQVSPQA